MVEAESGWRIADGQSGAAGWRAELSLRFAARGARSYLTERRHLGPLVVQRPFYPEGNPCHVYVVHPPGGIVGGDRLALNVHVEPGAHAVMTTPAATKFYRSEGALAQQTQQWAVDGGALEWLPQETIVYPGARAHCSTRIALNDSKLIAWEIFCLGLPAQQQPFESGSLRFDLELWRNEQPLYIDRLQIVGAEAARTAMWGLAGYQAIGTLLAFPADSRMLQSVRDSLGEDSQTVVTLVDAVLICRALASQAEQIKQNFIRIWQTLRPMLMDRPAVLPRIWAT